MSDFDVFLADCPARTTLALIGDTWSVVVIMALGERPRRYSELLERIGGTRSPGATAAPTSWCPTPPRACGPRRSGRSSSGPSSTPTTSARRGCCGPSIRSCVRAGGCWSWPASSAPCGNCLHIRTSASSLDDVDATMVAWRDAVVEGRAGEQGWPEWINIPSVGQVVAVRVPARERRAADAQDGTLVAAICPGLVDTEASRPWFEKMSKAQTPTQAAVALVRLALDRPADPSFYGELVQCGRVIPSR
jgi:hypothetical protein